MRARVRVLLRMVEPIIILCGFSGAAILAASTKFPRLVGNKGFLIAAAVVLALVGLYETYMYFVWERSVTAPIRLDIPVMDIPALLVGLVLAFIGFFWPRKPRER